MSMINTVTSPSGDVVEFVSKNELIVAIAIGRARILNQTGTKTAVA
jgi:hypothetical protein